jgi:hypothetical protein
VIGHNSSLNFFISLNYCIETTDFKRKMSERIWRQTESKCGLWNSWIRSHWQTHSKEGGQVELRNFNLKGDMCPFSARPHVNRWVEKMAKERVIETSEDATSSHARMGLNLTVWQILVRPLLLKEFRAHTQHHVVLNSKLLHANTMPKTGTTYNARQTHKTKTFT